MAVLEVSHVNEKVQKIMENDDSQILPGVPKGSAEAHAEYVEVRIKVVSSPKSKILQRNINEKSYHSLLPENSASSGRTQSIHDIAAVPSFQCDLCHKTFSSRQHLKRHQNTHSGNGLYQCKYCEKVLNDKSYLARHMKTHSSEMPYDCSTCGKKFRTASSAKRHMTNHNPDLRSHICSECGKRFPDNSSLNRHLRTHGGIKTHVCIICAKGFYHAGDLNIHLKAHDNVKPYRCEDCGKEFSRHNNLVRHKAVHPGEGAYKCSICNISFQHPATLTRHILCCHPQVGTVRRKQVLLAASEVSAYHQDDVESSADTCRSSQGLLASNGLGEGVEMVSDAASQEENASNHSIRSERNEIHQAQTKEVFSLNDEVQDLVQMVETQQDSNPDNRITLISSHDITKSNREPSAQQFELVQSSPTSFEIYSVDPSGSLVRISDSTPSDFINL